MSNLSRLLEYFDQRIERMEFLMTELAAEQAQIDSDVAEIRQSVATALAELRAQIAAGTPSGALDLTGLDKLAADETAEAAADAPAPVSPQSPAEVVTPASPAPVTVNVPDPTAAAPSGVVPDPSAPAVPVTPTA